MSLKLHFLLIGCLLAHIPLFGQSLFPSDTFDCASEKTTLKETARFDAAFKNYRIVTLDATALSNHLRSSGSTAKNVNLRLGADKNFGLVIRAHEMRTPDFKLLVGGVDGVKSYPRGENTTYTARFADEPKDNARLTVDDDFIQGFVRDGNDYVYIEPARFYAKSAPRNAFVVYQQTDVKTPKEDFCAFDEAEWRRAQSTITPFPQPESPCSAGKQVEFAVAADFQSYTNKGSVEDVKNYIFAIDNAMELKQYTSIFTISGTPTDISFTIKVFYIATSASSDPYSPLTVTNDGSVLLTNFGTWGAANFGTTYDLSQVWTGTNIQSSGNFGVAGIASTPGVCNATVAFRRQIDEDGNTGTSAAVMEQIVAHETGHNFNCLHDGIGACPAQAGAQKFLMNPSVDGDPLRTWSTCTKGVLEAFAGSASCLGNCTTLAAPVADFIASSKIVCAGSPTVFTDLSTNEPTSWSWTFTGGTPATATTGAPSVSWAAVGNYAVSMNSTNTLGTSSTVSKTNYVNVIATPTNQCSPTGANLSTTGITRVKLSNLDYSSGNGTVDGANYVNLACSKNTQLTVSTTYSMQVDLPVSAALRVWIDYNNNSSFADAGELVYAMGSGSSGSGNQIFSFSTPASPSTGRFLRMRVQANSDAFAFNPCSSYGSTTGQTEDFSVYFGSVFVLPVELLDFSGSWQKTHGALVWSTATEKRNQGFEIQRSFDGKSFEKVGFVKGMGESAQKQAYWFNDYNLAKTPQYAYYRLKQLDDNGDYSFSKIISIAPDNTTDWKIYPNPTATAEVKIAYEGQKEEDITIEWLDVIGRIRQSATQRVAKGQNIFDINTTSLSSGVYFVRIRTQNTLGKALKTIRFVKL